MGCNSTELKTPNDTVIPQNVRQILTNKCVQCHLGTSTGSLFNFGLDTQKMIQAELVKAGNPDESPLYQKLTSTPPYGSRMPKRGFTSLILS